MAKNPMTKRQLLEMRWSQLTTERSSWVDSWRDISENILPRNGQFFLEDRNRGVKRANRILDSTPTQCLKTLGAGLMAGATSPARPWFRLQTPHPDLNSIQAVKVWLDDVTQLMLRVFNASNTYRALQQMYEELAAFGTAAAIILPDFENVIHFYPLTIGEYCIATDAKGNVVTLYRRFQMQVSQIVKEYGYENCSASVQNEFDNGNLEAWRTIQQSIEPRYDRNPNFKDAKNMPWGSWHFEVGNSEDRFLRESGFKRFPAVCPRWSLSGGDIYGNGPGLEALGDCKQLMHQQLRKAQGIDYQTNPPIAAPATMKNKGVDRLPGGVTYYDNVQEAGQIKPIFDANTLRLDFLLEDINDVRQRIKDAFYTTLFLMISGQQDPRMTATEVAARNEEKMLMLGPVLERLTNELLEPMIDICFDALSEGNALPPAPQEMQGQELQVVLVSVLAQAQRAINTNSVDRFLNTIGAASQFIPEVLDKIDADELVDSYADDLGVDPSIVKDTKAVQALRDARAKAQAAQQAAALQEQQSKTAANLGTVQTGGAPNAANDMLSSFSGLAQ